VRAGIARAHAELARIGHAGQVAFDVAPADAVEHRAADHVEVPGLGVERGRRSHRQRQHLADQGPGHRLLQVAADAAPALDHVVETKVPVVSLNSSVTRPAKIRPAGRVRRVGQHAGVADLVEAFLVEGGGRQLGLEAW
jgi:hypothetical protein